MSAKNEPTSRCLQTTNRSLASQEDRTVNLASVNEDAYIEQIASV